MRLGTLPQLAGDRLTVVASTAGAAILDEVASSQAFLCVGLCSLLMYCGFAAAAGSVRSTTNTPAE